MPLKTTTRIARKHLIQKAGPDKFKGVRVVKFRVLDVCVRHNSAHGIPVKHCPGPPSRIRNGDERKIESTLHVPQTTDNRCSCEQDPEASKCVIQNPT